MTSQHQDPFAANFAISQLIDLTRLQAIFDRFALVSGLAYVLVEPSAHTALLMAGRRDICADFPPSQNDDLSDCQECWHQLVHSANTQTEYHLASCTNGLVYGVTPVVVDTVTIATLFVGPVLLDTPDIAQFTPFARSSGYDVDAFLAVLSTVPLTTEARLAEVLFFLRDTIAALAAPNLARLREQSVSSSSESEARYRHDLDERIKELQCLYRVSEIIRTETTLDAIFLAAAEVLPSGWHYPQVTRARIIFDGQTYALQAFAPTRWKQSSDITVHGQVRGQVEVYYLEECPELDEGPFLQEERMLIDDIATSLAHVVERKQVESVLQINEYMTASVVNDLLVGVVVHDADSRILFSNPEAHRILGLSAAQMKGKTAIDPARQFVREDLSVMPVAEYPVSQVIATGTRLKNLIFGVNKPGQVDITWVNVNAVPVFGADHQLEKVVINFVDISEQLRAEMALKASEERLRGIFRIAPIGIGLLRQRIIHDVNDYFCTMIGYSRQELLNQGTQMLYASAAEFDFVGREMLRHIRAQGIGTIETRFRRKDGTIIDVLISSTPHDPDNPMDGYISTVLDITKRKQAEAALRASEENLRTTLNSIGDAVIATDLAGHIVQMNPVAQQLTGWSLADAVGMPLDRVFNIVDEYTREQIESPVHKVLAQDRITTFANHTILLAKDGTEHLIADSAVPIHDRNGDTTGVVLVFRDMTEKYRTEHELQRMQQLESLGTIAGGIAHDFNNLLTGIFGNVELAAMFLPQGHRSEVHLQKAHQNLDAAKHLTQQLLTFAKGGKPSLRMVDLAELVRDAVAFNLRGSTVKPHFTVAEKLWPIRADKSQMSQVVANITINATQAMPEGGNFYVEMQNIDDAVALSAGHLAGACVRIVLRDEGAGIAAKIIERVFDPYFTTRPSGRGLGLSIVHSIITRHGGHVSITSTPNVGTTVSVLLPVDFAAAEPASGTGADADNESQNSPIRVLLMDDEAMIREVGTAMLRRLGYLVDTAVDGDEAVQKYAAALEAGQPFGVVIMDLTIPGGKGGGAAIQELRHLDPEVKAIVSSGYSSDPLLANYQAHGFAGQLPKPFRMDDLSAVILQVLD